MSSGRARDGPRPPGQRRPPRCPAGRRRTRPAGRVKPGRGQGGPDGPRLGHRMIGVRRGQKPVLRRQRGRCQPLRVNPSRPSAHGGVRRSGGWCARAAAAPQSRSLYDSQSAITLATLYLSASANSSSAGSKYSVTTLGCSHGIGALRSVRDFARKEWPLRGSPAGVKRAGVLRSAGGR